jgi:hypothetical protein
LFLIVICFLDYFFVTGIYGSWCVVERGGIRPQELFFESGGMIYFRKIIFVVGLIFFFFVWLILESCGTKVFVGGLFVFL